MHLRFRSEGCQIEEASIAAGVDIEAILRFPESVGQEQGEQDVEDDMARTHPFFTACLNYQGSERNPSN